MEKKVKTLKEVAALVAKESKRPSAEAAKNITTALLNEKDYVVKSVKTVKGEKKVTEYKPVEEFRTMIAGIVTKAGVDEADAKKFMENYTFKPKDGAVIVPLANAVVVENLKTGKMYNLVQDETCTATLKMKHLETSVNTYRNPKTGEEIKIKAEAHDRIIAKSATPKFLKSKV